MIATADGGLWIGTDDAGLLHRSPDGAWLEPGHTTDLPSRRVLALAVGGTAPAVTIWIGTEGAGLIRRRGAHEWRLTTADGLPGDFVLSLDAGGFGDVPATLFVGTLTGFAQFDVDSWLTVDRHSGLPDDTVVSILDTPAREGGRRLWLGTVNGGLAGYGDGRWTVYDAAFGLGSPAAYCLATDEDRNALWVGTNDGLAWFDGRRWRHYNVADGLPHPVVVGLLATDDPGGAALWIGTFGGGVCRLARDSWTISDVASGDLANGTIETLLEVPHRAGAGGAIWIATNGGVTRYDGGSWRQVDEYVTKHTRAVISHGLCPECRKREFDSPATPAH